MSVTAARPTLVLMHFLGGSARQWDELVEELGPGCPTLRHEHAGFGDAAGETGYTVAEMADAVQARLRDVPSFVLVGHSMSGKISCVVARRMQDAGDARLKGLVLVAPSPPGPEPMTETKRGASIALLGTLDPARGPEAELERARKYVAQNAEGDIPAAVAERTAREALRTNRTAWVAWLTHGSREDWAQRVGVLETRALVVAGEKDGSLGTEVQQQVTLPQLLRGRLVTVKGSNHLVPMERPAELAELLREFVEEVMAGEQQQGDGVLVPAEYMRLIEGERVSARTREVLEERMAGPKASAGLLTDQQEAVLRAMVARVVSQEGTGIDLAGYVMARLAGGKGDGWRYAVLPGDVAAYRAGLDALAARGFAGMSGEAQDEVLRGLAAEKGSAQARWFEDVRADAVEAYMGHPATLARLGYSGIGVGGAHTKFQGYVELRPGHRESWEPVPVRANEERPGEAR